MTYRLMDPSSVLDWQHDWSSFLAEGDSISSRQWSISPLNGTTPETPTLANDTTATVTVSGLEAGKVYRLVEHIVTANGIEAERSIVLRGEDR